MANKSVLGRRENGQDKVTFSSPLVFFMAADVKFRLGLAANE
jgi:hypothetical protein